MIRNPLTPLEQEALDMLIAQMPEGTGYELRDGKPNGIATPVHVIFYLGEGVTVSADISDFSHW